MRTLLVSSLLASSLALADLTTTTETALPGKPVQRSSLSVKGSKALFEVEEGQTRRVMLRDATQKTMFVINHEHKEVVVMPDQQPKGDGPNQERFRAELAEQLAKLPPEKRARVEQTMLTQQPAAPKKPVTTWEKKDGPARTVSGFSCVDYVIKRDGVVAGQGCFASWKDVGVPLKDYVAAMRVALPIDAQAEVDDMSGAPGLVVWRERTLPGGTKSEVTLKSISVSAQPAAKFELPKGYAQRTLSEVMNRGLPAQKP